MKQQEDSLQDYGSRRSADEPVGSVAGRFEGETARKSAHPNAHAEARGKTRWRPNPKYAAVLKLLVTSPFLRPACEKVGCSTGALYRDMRLHPEFRQKVEDARGLGYERVEAEAYRRGVSGDEEYVVSGGKIVMMAYDDQGHELERPIPLKRRRCSDRMLELILKGNLRDKYGTTRAEITGKDGAGLSVPKREQEPEADLSRLTDDELRIMLRLQLKACGLPEEGGSHG